MAPKLTPAEFAQQFADAHARLWRLAAALVGERGDAEDLVQEAAIVALKKLDDFEPGTNFNAWMSRIVRLHAMNWWRKQAGRRTTATDPVDIDQSQAGAPVTTELEPTADRLAAGDTSEIGEHFDEELLRRLHALDEAPRACLLLRVVHGLSYDEIAAMLDIPPGTAMSHVHRSKKRLRAELPAQVGINQPKESRPDSTKIK